VLARGAGQIQAKERVFHFFSLDLRPTTLVNATIQTRRSQNTSLSLRSHRAAYQNPGLITKLQPLGLARRVKFALLETPELLHLRGS